MKSRINWPRFKSQPTPLNLILLSAALVFIFFLLQGNVGFNIADEGFLWYGTVRTALGEVPVRDFQAYDPGRYYWGALWFKVIGSDGIIALRVSQAVLQFLGLSVALLLLRRVLRSWLALTVAAGVLLLWMFPQWKIYEHVTNIVALYFATLLIENPSRKRHLMAGTFVGMAAFFGRNHGVYCFAAFLLLILFIRWRIDRGSLPVRVGAWGLGIVIGYAPMLFMFAFVPGFFGACVEVFTSNLRVGTTPLLIPVPWPWVHDYSRLGLGYSIQMFALGLLYLALPLFYLLAGLKLLFTNELRDKTLLIACTFVGVMYLHYAFSIPQLYYVAWNIPPFLIGVMALPHSFAGPHKKAVTAAAWSSLLALSWAAVGISPENHFVVKPESLVETKTGIRLNLVRDQGTMKADIGGDKIWVDADTARIIGDVQAVNRELIPAGEEVLIAPHWTSLYPILRKKSPLWEIYFMLPEPLNEQEKMAGVLEREHVNWAFVCPDARLAGRDDLTFPNTHSYLWQYLVANFEPVPARLPPGCELLHRTAPGASPPLAPSAASTPDAKDSSVRRSE